MATLNQTTVILAVRDLIDEIYYDRSDVISRAAITGSVASNLSDVEIVEFAETACRYLVARVESEHFPNFLKSTTPGEDLTEPVGRLVEGTVEVGDVDARRVSFKAHRRMMRQRRIPTDSFPVYAYEDGDLTVFGKTENPSTATAKVLVCPTPVLYTSLGTAILGTPNTINILADLSLIEADHVSAMVVVKRGGIGESDFHTVIDSFVNSTTMAISPPLESDFQNDIITWEKTSIMQIDERWQSAIVARTSELILGSLGRVDLSGIAASMFGKSIGSDALQYAQSG